MKPQDCAQYSICPKIDSLADRDCLESQFADGVLKVCGECEEGIGQLKELEALAEDRDLALQKLDWIIALILDHLKHPCPEAKEGSKWRYFRWARTSDSKAYDIINKGRGK